MSNLLFVSSASILNLFSSLSASICIFFSSLSASILNLFSSAAICIFFSSNLIRSFSLSHSLSSFKCKRSNSASSFLACALSFQAALPNFGDNGFIAILLTCDLDTSSTSSPYVSLTSRSVSLGMSLTSPNSGINSSSNDAILPLRPVDYSTCRPTHSAKIHPRQLTSKLSRPNLQNSQNSISQNVEISRTNFPDLIRQKQQPLTCLHGQPPYNTFPTELPPYYSLNFTETTPLF